MIFWNRRSLRLTTGALKFRRNPPCATLTSPACATSTDPLSHNRPASNAPAASARIGRPPCIISRRPLRQRLLLRSLLAQVDVDVRRILHDRASACVHHGHGNAAAIGIAAVDAAGIELSAVR